MKIYAYLKSITQTAFIKHQYLSSLSVFFHLDFQLFAACYVQGVQHLRLPFEPCLQINRSITLNQPK